MEETLPNNQQLTVKNVIEKIKKFLTKRNLIIIFILVFSVSLTVAALLLNSSKKNVTNTTGTNVSYGTITFDPPSILITPNKPTTAYISINTNGKPIAGAHVVIKYNPLLIKLIALQPYKDPNSSFASSLSQNGEAIYNNGQGVATLSVLLPANTPNFAANGKIARAIFIPLSPKAALLSTQITFMESTSFFLTKDSASNNIARKPLTVKYSEKADSINYKQSPIQK